MYGRIININETLKEVCKAIASAETITREHIKLYYHDANEEFITFALYCHIQQKLGEASRGKRIEKAFVEDLKAAFRNRRIFINWELQRKLNERAMGLVADIVLHNRRQEGKTGGDFGLIVVRPQIIGDNDSTDIKRGHSSGLLCQAKLRNEKGKWGSFTDNQKEVLPECLDYTSLVLYSFVDNARSELNPLAWKLCKGNSFSEVEKLLNKSKVDGTRDTADIVKRLGRSEIGTDNQALIDKYISPSSQHHLEIRIDWPEDSEPKKPTEIKIQHKQKTQSTVHIRLRH